LTHSSGVSPVGQRKGLWPRCRMEPSPGDQKRSAQL